MVKRIALGMVMLLLCAFVTLVALCWMFLAVLGNSTRAWRLAVSFDQLANTAFGGSEDETISSRAGKAARQGKRWGCLLCGLLNRFEPDHCEKNIEADEGKMSA